MITNKLVHWITGSFIPDKPLPPPCSNNAAAVSSAAPTTVVVPASMIPPATEPCRKLLPAALFLLTFFTVMTMLLVYMDTTAMRQQQFRLNMSREYELAGVSQDDPALVAYIKEWQLVSVSEPFPPHSRHHSTHPVPPPEEPELTPTEKIVARLLNYKKNGVFVEVGAYSSGNGVTSRTEWLEQTLNWRGLIMTPNARDYFRMRAVRTSAPSTLATHACLSTSAHPKEITFQETSSHEEVGVMAIGTSATEEFSSRVKCFPLYSLLLAAKAQQADFLSLSCDHCYIAALVSLPHHKTKISIIEIVEKDPKGVDSLLRSRGYAMVGKTPDSTIYALRDFPNHKL